MYVPPKFAVEDRDKQLQDIRDQGWGCVVSSDGAAPIATHLLQNRPAKDRARVADRLAQSPDSNARSIAEMISRHAS